MEKRKYPRLDVYNLVKYRPLSKAEAQLVLNSTKNISAGGVCVETNEYLAVSTVLQLYINIPQSSQPIPALAKVAWIKKTGKPNKFEVGLQFIEIEETLRQSLAKRIDYAHKKSLKK